MALKLRLPLEAYDELHRLSDGRGKMASIPKVFLRQLLMDHGKLLRYLDDARVNITWGEDDE